jgi:EF-P beta-lysylation protein EpmB
MRLGNHTGRIGARSIAPPTDQHHLLHEHQMTIARLSNIAPTPRWQQLWRDAIQDPRELLESLGLWELQSSLAPEQHLKLPFRVPRGFAARMRYGDAKDPLLLQVLPQLAELQETPGYAVDPVGDGPSRSATGVLHKYAGRALLIATGSCAIHCRYCFRQHFPYADETAAVNHWRDAIAHLRSDPSITELLLSGGDPLSLATHKLAELSSMLPTIPHIRRLRIHTRLPIVLPERVDTDLVEWIARLKIPCVVVVHANHANEIDASVTEACKRLRAAGATLLNQSVLLKGINDSVEALAALSESLLDCGVIPYYLHQLDRVLGTAHFEIADYDAHRLVDALRARLPGYLVPRLVREIAGAPYKVPLPSALHQT